MGEFSRLAMKRLIRKANGGEFLVARSAAIELGAVLEDLGEEIGGEALRISKNQGRKTVKRNDVMKAVKRF